MLRKPVFIAMFILALAGMACRATSQPTITPETALVSGEQVFKQMGCSACHDGKAGEVAPSLKEIFGEEVQLESGETVITDENYLRESILTPSVKVVRGYMPIMPEFQDRLTDEQLNALIEYIRSLSEK